MSFWARCSETINEQKQTPMKTPTKVQHNRVIFNQWGRGKEGDKNTHTDKRPSTCLFQHEWRSKHEKQNKKNAF